MLMNFISKTLSGSLGKDIVCDPPNLSPNTLTFEHQEEDLYFSISREWVIGCEIIQSFLFPSLSHIRGDYSWYNLAQMSQDVLLFL